MIGGLGGASGMLEELFGNGVWPELREPVTRVLAIEDGERRNYIERIRVLNSSDTVLVEFNGLHTVLCNGVCSLPIWSHIPNQIESIVFTTRTALLRLLCSFLLLSLRHDSRVQRAPKSRD
uniref:Uncharacterized protein n=1 Tax=Cannabis sativa TaxID=3483 RepID=A0A803QQE2_CANSA